MTERDWADFAYSLDSTELCKTRSVYRPISRTYSKDAFEGAIASGLLEVVEPERQVTLGRMYRQYAKADAI